MGSVLRVSYTAVWNCMIHVMNVYQNQDVVLTSLTSWSYAYFMCFYFVNRKVT